MKAAQNEMTSRNENSRLQIKIRQGTSLEMITVNILTLHVFFQKYVKENERS